MALARVPSSTPSAAATLPDDEYRGTLVGRIWDPACAGPSPVLIREDGVFDLSRDFPTMRDLCEQPNPTQAAATSAGNFVGELDGILRNTHAAPRDPHSPWLLAPVDLQTVKAAGVTFAASLIERVIEERAGGDIQAAADLRRVILGELGSNLRAVRPGSLEATKLKVILQERNLWSQYLEVGIGPDAEIFTKAPTLAAVGTGFPVGVLSSSNWNNPEPEVTVIVASTGVIVGATLGNDVNLRDYEGRSALLLSKAKDNNASCAIGPFIRLFDDTFDLDTVRDMSVRLEIDGTDGFHLEAVSEMSEISRDPEDLVAQLIGRDHQYPDGASLMLGTMFAPVVDRGLSGMGFTHHDGDVVRILAPELGCLSNEVRKCEDCEPWSFGLSDLMRNLASRKLW